MSLSTSFSGWEHCSACSPKRWSSLFNISCRSLIPINTSGSTHVNSVSHRPKFLTRKKLGSIPLLIHYIRHKSIHPIFVSLFAAVLSTQLGGGGTQTSFCHPKSLIPPPIVLWNPDNNASIMAVPVWSVGSSNNKKRAPAAEHWAEDNNIHHKDVGDGWASPWPSSRRKRTSTEIYFYLFVPWLDKCRSTLAATTTKSRQQTWSEMGDRVEQWTLLPCTYSSSSTHCATTTKYEKRFRRVK